MSKFGVFLLSTIFGVLLWWGLCFIHSVEQFHDDSHAKVCEWVSAPTTDSADSGTDTGETEETPEE